MSTATAMTPAQIRAHVLAVFSAAPADVAAGTADRVAAVECGYRPGAVLGSDVGIVRYEPDPRFPGEPFVREDDEVRFGLRRLGEVYLLDQPGSTS